MSYYKLPKINNNIQEKDIILDFYKFTNESDNDINSLLFVNESLHHYLYLSKKQISKNFKEWDIYKKYTNPYEFIHTCYDNTHCISKVRPLSRAYYKMIEIIKYFNLFDNYKNKPIKSFHLAEGPGGFIEAFVNTRQNKADIYYGMTLINSSNNIPGWKKSKSFLEKNKNVIIELGTTQNGDLYAYDNLNYIIKNHNNSCDIVTGDGGFDFSVDFSKQEINALRLIYSQILYALILQKNGGTFILKIFDLFNKSTIDLIYILRLLYEDVYITKPKTSRYANSEKYIVCIHYKREIFNKLSNKLMNIFRIFEKVDFEKYTITSFLSKNYSLDFKKSIQEINSIIGEQQLSVINNTIILIKKTNINNNRLELEKKNNIQKCIEWCIEHNIPYNDYKKSNIFMS